MYIYVALLSLGIIAAQDQYSLYFKDRTASLTYNYETPVDFTNAQIKFKISVDSEYYNNLFESGTSSIKILDINSLAADDVFDFLQVELMSSGSNEPPIIMVVMGSPKTSGLEETSYCLMMLPFDFSNSEITINKSGPYFSLAVEGMEDSNVYCDKTAPMGAPVTGAMTVSYIKLSELVGCTSLLSFPAVDFLSSENCGSASEFVSENVVYFKGSCDDVIPDSSYVCPLPPAEIATEPPKAITPIPEKHETEGSEIDDTNTGPDNESNENIDDDTNSESGNPSDDKDNVDDKNTGSDDVIEDTGDEQEIENPDKTIDDENVDDKTIDENVDDKTIDENVDDKTIDENIVDHEDSNDIPDEGSDNSDNTGVVVIDNNDTDYTFVEEEASTDEGSSSVVIIICVVVAGIVVVVVLLYVGYRFHFRDKGSYKLEEAKGDHIGDEFGNEYTDLNHASKDQEWYL